MTATESTCYQEQRILVTATESTCYQEQRILVTAAESTCYQEQRVLVTATESTCYQEQRILVTGKMKYLRQCMRGEVQVPGSRVVRPTSHASCLSAVCPTQRRRAPSSHRSPPGHAPSLRRRGRSAVSIAAAPPGDQSTDSP